MQATSLLGLAQYANGDLESAERSLSNFHTNMRKTGEILTLIGITFLLADIRVALGRLHGAESIYQQTLRIATSQGEPMPLGTADLYRGLAELSVERGDLEAAAQYLLTSQKLGEQTATTDWPHRLCVSQARLKEAQGDLDGALALLDEAERLYIRSPLPDVRPIAALKARLWIRQYKLTEALGWARAQSLSVDNDLSFLHEFEHITLARMLIAQYQNDRVESSIHQALRLLERLLQTAEEGGRMGKVIEILVLQALAFQAQDNLPHALAPLERALALSEPEGYVRTFVDAGEPMRLLIADCRFSIEKQMSRSAHAQLGYTSKLLAAFAQPSGGLQATTLAPHGSAGTDHAQSAISNLKSAIVEPLSERELEVLKLLRSELNGPEIAQQLSVSINTFRTHTKNIFIKLGVNDRRAAIRRAEDLDFF
jgi:LuxR family maltose regulon positive regulatory protein